MSKVLQTKRLIREFDSLLNHEALFGTIHLPMAPMYLLNLCMYLHFSIYRLPIYVCSSILFICLWFIENHSHVLNSVACIYVIYVHLNLYKSKSKSIIDLSSNMYPSIHLFIELSICLSVCLLPTCLPSCLSVRLSVSI